jgi:hypothetical protein
LVGLVFHGILDKLQMSENLLTEAVSRAQGSNEQIQFYKIVASDGAKKVGHQIPVSQLPWNFQNLYIHGLLSSQPSNRPLRGVNLSAVRWRLN